jgi:cysteine-rich repeat protein
MLEEREMRFPRLAGLLLLLASLCRTLPALATTANDVCTGDPCVLSKGVTLTAGSVLDFGNRAFRMAQSGGLFAGDGDSVIISARAVAMDPGAIIRGPLFPSVGASVRIETTQDIVIQRSGASRARIDVHGQRRGGVIALVAGRNIDLTGDLRADGTLAEAIGGAVDVDADGTITMTGDINASGGLGIDGSGGAVRLNAGGAIVAGAIDASSGSGDGSIEMTSLGAITATGVLSVAGNAAGGGGGEVTLDASGNIAVSGRIAAQGGAGSLADDGTGGDVDISSDGNVRVTERIEAFGGGPAGEAGFVTITAGADLTVTQPISVHGPGTTAGGGFVDLLAAGGVLTIEALIDVHGFTAGSVTGQAGSEVRARGEINADGQTGEIDLSTISITGTQVPGPVTVSGNLHARGPAGGFSGTIALQGCDVTVDATGRLVTAGDGAINRLRSSRQMTVAGQVIAGPPGTNRFEYRNDPGLVPIIAAGAVVQPPPALVASASLLPCRAPTPPVCGNGMTESGESCDDGNTRACDGCSAVCAQESCGNSMVECGEGCDDGNVTDGDGCDANCTNTACGNRRVTGAEQCDDGNRTPGDGCDADCRIEAPPGCGNGMTEAGEECDDNNTNDCDGCSHLCLTEGCGNNRVECGELCDEGNAANCDGDGCAADCRSQEICGDGTVQCQEQCDAGANNSLPGVGCNALCRLCALGSDDCPCGADTDCHTLGKCGGLACADGVCVSVEPPTCSDNNVCNGVESCADGGCAVGTPLQCADADPCTADSCDRRAGCQHAPATGLASVSCRVEALRLALDAAPTDVPTKVRRKLDGAAGKLQLAVDAAAGAGTDPKRLGRLLKRVERSAKKALAIVTKAARKNQLPAALATSLQTAADGARVAAEGLRRSLPR